MKDQGQRKLLTLTLHTFVEFRPLVWVVQKLSTAELQGGGAGCRPRGTGLQGHRVQDAEDVSQGPQSRSYVTGHREHGVRYMVQCGVEGSMGVGCRMHSAGVQG